MVGNSEGEFCQVNSMHKHILPKIGENHIDHYSKKNFGK